ncbi:hypothetical protein D9M71_510290 [compost metagenome]
MKHFIDINIGDFWFEDAITIDRHCIGMTQQEGEGEDRQQPAFHSIRLSAP